MTTPLVVALIGNPNTGKSTLFNALSGSRALTGNYPGVTVERKIGRTRFGDRVVDIIDLPGTYSLAPRSLDEMVAVDVLLGRQPDTPRPEVVVCIVDASNLERNLYLVSQVRELGLPVVLVLNMTDVAAERGVTFDPAQLSQRLGLPLVTTEAHRRRGIDQLREALLEAADSSAPTASLPAIFPPSSRRNATPWPISCVSGVLPRWTISCGSACCSMWEAGLSSTPPRITKRN